MDFWTKHVENQGDYAEKYVQILCDYFVKSCNKLPSIFYVTS